ncbi:MAG: GntR family transcriptional regulator [Victivallales bacterium]|nr:GntR family transcriptional regulator [Victivallales bacterium]
MIKNLHDELPLRIRVREKIMELVHSLDVGAKIPSERELCTHYDVSKITLRRALRDLIDQGILYSRQGKGTFLKKRLTKSKKAQSKILGLIIPEIKNPFTARIAEGVEIETSRCGYNLFLSFYRPNHPEVQLTQLRQLLSRQLDGLLIFADTALARRSEYVNLLRHAEDQGISVVFIDHYFPELKNARCVMSDNVSGMYQAVEHLILQGHRRPSLLALGKEHNVLDQLRHKGFRNAMLDYKLPPEPVMKAELGVTGHEESAYKIVNEWIKKSNKVLPFDAIVCMQDNIAYGAYRALRDAGLKVPEDIALTGYDNLDRDLYKAAGLELSSVEQHPEKMGEEAAKLLINDLNDSPGKTKAKHILIKTELVIRSSCGRAFKSPIQTKQKKEIKNEKANS